MIEHRPARISSPRADRTVTITPSRARAFARCPLQYSETFGATRPDDGRRHLQMGQYIHELADRYNKAVMAGRSARVDDVLEQTPLPLPLRDGSDGESSVRDFGRESLEAYQSFLEDQHFAAVVASEHYVRTPPRPVIGAPGCSIVLSGRFDLIATRETASADDIAAGVLPSVVCIDVKTALSADLADHPSSAVYDHLARYAYRTDNVELMQVTRTGQWTSVRLTPAQIETGVQFCRAMVAAVSTRQFPAHPGGQCDYCPLVSTTCPAHQPRPGWDTAF